LDVTGFVDGNETYINAGLSSTNPTRFKVYNESYKGALSLYDDGNTEDVKITTGGNSWFNGGNVGIGTTGPINKLDVNGDASVVNLKVGSAGSGEGVIRFNGGSGNGIGITTGTNDSSGIGLFVDHSTNNRSVGIGTTTPTAKLEVSGDSNSWAIKTNSNGVNDSGFYTDSSENIDLYLRQSDGTIGVLANPNGNSYFNGGNVGIGTTSPSAKLQVNGGDVIVGDGTGDNRVYAYYNDGSHCRMHGYGFYFDRSSSYLRPTTDGDKNLYIGTSSSEWQLVNIDSEATVFQQDGTEVMRVHTNGNVGIGTASPSEKLQVNGNIKAEDVILDSVQASSDVRNKIVPHDGAGNMEFHTTTGERMTITSAGDVGIGTGSPSEKLEVNGNAKADSFIKDGSTSDDVLLGDGTTTSLDDLVSNDTTGEPTGSDSVNKIVSLTQAEYDAGTPVSDTFYLITDA
jgi:hypothetical protein